MMNKKLRTPLFERILWNLCLWLGCFGLLLAFICWIIYFAVTPKINLLLPLLSTIITLICFAFIKFEDNKCFYCNKRGFIKYTPVEHYELGVRVGSRIIDIKYQGHAKCENCGKEWYYGSLEREIYK